MADYDTKSIPILDDIIEHRPEENATGHGGVSIETDDATRITENEPDLFSSDKSGHNIDEELEPQIGSIDDFAEDQDNEARQIDFSAVEFSALNTEISYETEVEIDLTEADAETIESALIDYRIEADETDTDFAAHLYTATDSAVDLEPEAVVIDFQQANIIEQPVEEASEVFADFPADTSDETVTLESVVDDIVRQLIPDLEQQLRFLVQQALEDRLSDDVLDRLSTKNNKS